MVVVGESTFFNGCFGQSAMVEVSGCAYGSRLGRVGFVGGGRHVHNVRVRAHGDPDIRTSTIWRWTTFLQFPEVMGGWPYGFMEKIFESKKPRFVL